MRHSVSGAWRWRPTAEISSARPRSLRCGWRASSLCRYLHTRHRHIDTCTHRLGCIFHNCSHAEGVHRRPRPPFPFLPETTTRKACRVRPTATWVGREGHPFLLPPTVSCAAAESLSRCVELLSRPLQGAGRKPCKWRSATWRDAGPDPAPSCVAVAWEATDAFAGHSSARRRSSQ